MQDTGVGPTRGMCVTTQGTYRRNHFLLVLGGAGESAFGRVALTPVDAHSIPRSVVRSPKSPEPKVVYTQLNSILHWHLPRSVRVAASESLRYRSLDSARVSLAIHSTSPFSSFGEKVSVAVNHLGLVNPLKTTFVRRSPPRMGPRPIPCPVQWLLSRG